MFSQNIFVCIYVYKLISLTKAGFGALYLLSKSFSILEDSSQCKPHYLCPGI